MQRRSLVKGTVAGLGLVASSGLWPIGPLATRMAAADPLDPTSSDRMPFNGLGFGCGQYCISPCNIPIKSATDITTYSWRVDRTGTITHVIVEIASNQGPWENKSAGVGELELDWFLYRGDENPLPGEDSHPPGHLRIPSRPQGLVTSGSIVHRRGPNGYDGDRRRFHKIPIGNVDATKGQYLHLGFLNRHASPNENFVSLNMPSMLAVNVIRSTPPWHGSPPRRLSVHGGDHRSFVLRRQPNGSYIRRHPFMPQVSYVYADGLKLGDAYRFGHHLLREQATVGGGTRLRQRWRHVADDIACDAAWLFCHWPLAAGQPTAPLQVTVSEDATDTEPGWSRIASLPASPVTDGSDGAPGLVQCWSEAADGTFAWWSRADFADGGPLRFAAGRTYTVEVSSETTLQQPYRLHPIQLGLSIGRNDDDRAADLNVWREDPADAGRPSYAERWPDGGDGWRTFRLGWDRPDARRRDVALPIWFQRA